MPVEGDGVVVLMHGDLEVSAKKLARLLGVKSTSPCILKSAERRSGYRVGGTSPFGLKTSMPIIAQESIQELETLFINGGHRGLLVCIKPEVIEAVLDCDWADVSA